MQAAAIFYSSDIIFCRSVAVPDRKEQCLTKFKVLASAVVCLGVLVYSLPKAKTGPTKDEPTACTHQLMAAPAASDLRGDAGGAGDVGSP